MRVRQAIARSFGIAAAALAFGGAVSLAVVVLFCPRHAAAVARARGGSPVVLDSGFRFARPGEWIYTCTTPHTVAGIVVHEDLGCYCAPAGSVPASLGLALGGTCEVARINPSRLDADGACEHAHCQDDDLSGLVPLVRSSPRATPQR